jgi:hypothetical protein
LGRFILRLVSSFPLEWSTLLPAGVPLHRGVIVTALPESLIIDIMKIYSFFDVPVGHVGHFTTARTFFGRSRWNPHLRSDLREGVKLKCTNTRRMFLRRYHCVGTVIFLESTLSYTG